MITERNGLGRGGEADAAQAAAASAVTSATGETAAGAAASAAAPPAAAQAAGSGPVPWPGTPLPSQRQAAIGPSGYGADSGAESWGHPDMGEPQFYPSGAGQPEPEKAHEEPVSFWDWAPADDGEDTRFSIDDEPGKPAPAAPGAAITPAVLSAASADPDAEPMFTDVTPPPRQEGIGHRLGRLDHIFGHSRMGYWRRRAVIAVVIFVLIWVLLDSWQLAVTLAVLAVIADTIIQSRTVTNPLPGVRMTRAQRKTLLQLGKLEKSGYKALHARLIPDSDEHIDHLVIGPAGVFSVDSEYWDKHLPIRTKNARQLWHGPFSMKDRLEHARWESERAAELLSAASGMTVSVRPAMAVYGPKIPWDVMTIRDVDVFSGGRLRNYLRRYARHNNARPLSTTDIDRIYKAAHAAFPHLNPGVLAT
jgi:hypothetical protein